MTIRMSTEMSTEMSTALSAEMSSAVVRRAARGDAAAIARIYAPYVTDTVISFEEAPPTADEILARVRCGPE